MQFTPNCFIPLFQLFRIPSVLVTLLQQLTILQASTKMRSNHFPSSPPSQEGTAPTPSTNNTANTAVTDDDLALAVSGLTLSQEKK